MIFISCNLHAYDVEVNGIYYNLDTKALTAEVTRGDERTNKYKGDVVVPQSVSYNNMNYVVNAIGDRAFYMCDDLTSVIIPYSVKIIGEDAFASCMNCKSITMSNGVKTIKAYAFWGCSGLTSISIPQSVQSIDDTSFQRSGRNMESIVVDANNAYFDSRNNCNAIIRKSDMTLLLGCKNTVIPDGVKKIVGEAFFLCVDLKSVNLPTSLVEIGVDAFYGCSSLSQLIIPSGVTTFGGGGNPFKDCGGLQSISVDSNNPVYDSRNNCNAIIKKSGNILIRGCSNTVIPNTVVTIGFSAFSECKDLYSVKLPTGIASIDGCAFDGCSMLASIEIPKSVTSIGGDAFRGCESLTDIYITSLDSWCKIKGDYMYFDSNHRLILNGSELKDITIPNGIVEIGRSLAYSSINSVTLPNSVTSIGRNAFQGSTLASIEIPNSVTTIGAAAFYECRGLSAIKLPSSLEKIEDAAFRNCAKLKLVKTYVTSPFDIPDYVFKGINRSASLQVPSGTGQLYMSFSGWSQNFIGIIEFEQLTIKAIGGGSVTFNNENMRDSTCTFDVVDKSSATLTITPDEGYRIKSLKVNSVDVTSYVKDGQYTISDIIENTMIEVVFEAIPLYTISIISDGNGKTTYGITTIKNQSKEFSEREGSTIAISFTPDNGYRLSSVTVNGEDMLSQVVNNQLTIENITTDILIEVYFGESPITEFAKDNINYKVISSSDRTVNVVRGNYGVMLTVPSTCKDPYINSTWIVAGVEPDAFNNSPNLAAIIWNPEEVFNGNITNPNLLLYVKDKKYAPTTVRNVVVDNVAEEITLSDAESGNPFYCPKAFTAQRITYEHNYSMTSGYQTCQGWETLALPFNVTTIQRQNGTEIVPREAWVQGSNKLPFWLYTLTELGWRPETTIAANTPYIISMPNNENYNSKYNISGVIQFIGTNVEVKASDNMPIEKNGNKIFVPNYQYLPASESMYALNVNNQWCANTTTEAEGSVFIKNLRPVHPFEAYLTVNGSEAARRIIPIFEEGESTGIINLPLRDDINVDTWFTLDGRKLFSKPTEKGVYINKGKKVLVK